MSRRAWFVLQKTYMAAESKTARGSGEGALMSAQIASEPDVTFKTHEHGALAATLYRPAAAAIAAVVEVHGGAWTSGDRSSNAATARHLAANGIAVLSV